MSTKAKTTAPADATSNVAAPADDFTHEVRDLVRTSKKAELELADIGKRTRATFKQLGITDKAAAFAALSGQYDGRPEGVLFQPMKAGLVRAYVHEDDLATYEDKNKDGKTAIQTFNFRTGKFGPSTKGDITKAIGAVGTKLRARIIANTFARKTGDPTPADVARCYELVECRRKLKNMNGTGRGADENAIDRLGGFDAAAAMIAAIDTVIGTFPKSIQVAAKAKSNKE